MSSDDNARLIAKVQYFGDLMMTRLNEYEDICLSSTEDLERLSAREKAVELNALMFEYSKTFQAFLYKHEDAV